MRRPTRSHLAAVAALAVLAGSCGPAAAPPRTGPPASVDLGGAQDDAELFRPLLVEPGLRLPEELAPLRYRARLAIDPAERGFRGSIAIEAELRRPADVVWLHARDLMIEHATAETADGVAELELVPTGRDVIGLSSTRRLPAGRVTIRIEYAGTLGDARGAFVQAERGVPYVFTQFQALDARRVFPCVDEPGVKVPWELTLEVPADQVALANAPAVREEPLGDGRKRVVFAETPPVPSYLVAFAIGPFELVDAGTTRGGAPIRIATFHGRAAEAAWAKEVTPKVVEILEDWFGTPYPYAKLDSVPIPATVGFGAMENAGLITYREDILLVDPKRGTQDDKRRYVWYAGHELAHHWFGNLVTPAWWDDLWLNEAFASWMEEKVLATFSPAWSLRVPVVVTRSEALDADGLVSARRVRQPIEAEDDIRTAFDRITYRKGSSVIRMFEAWIGPDAFRDGVRRFLDAHAWGTATSADFLAALDAATDLDVTSAFRTFLDQPGAPRVGATLRCAKGAPPVVTLTQERWLPRGVPAPAGDPPRWQVPVCVAHGTVKTRATSCTVLTEPSAELVLDGTCPAWVWPNAEARGYFRAGLDRAALDALLAHGWPQLRPHERIAVAGDVRAAVARGELPIDAQLALVPRLLVDGSRHAIETAVELVGDAVAVASDEARPALAAWIRDTFGKQARKLGFLPGKKDDLDRELTRAALIRLVAEHGEDDVLGARAVELARAWKDLPAPARPLVLRVAARRDPKVRAELRAAVTATADRRVLGDLFEALGAVDDADAARDALALLLDPAVDLVAARELILDLAGQPRAQPVVEAFLREHVDALLARWPGGGAAGLVRALTASCDPARRADAEAWARERLERLPGGPRTVAQALEAMDHCIAKKGAMGPEVDAWIAARKAR